MKRILLLIVLATLACIGFAQVASYTFGYSAGIYTEITGGTVLGTATIGGTGTSALDNVTYPNVSIPYFFPFNGRQYNQVTVNSNGYLVFGGTSAISESNQISNSSVTPDGIVVVYGKDNKAINADGSLGEIRYDTLGTAPNRIFVIQWKNFMDYSGSTDVLNFQIRLYETTKVIEFVYGNCSVVNTETCQVGLRGTTNADFLTRTTTTDWTASTAGGANNATMAVSPTIYPPNGTVFTFTPPAPSTFPNVATVISPTDGNPAVMVSETLNWADGGGWTDGFKLYFSPTSSFPPATPLDLNYVTTYDPPGDMLFNTPYTWQIVPYNTAYGDNTTGSIWTFTTAGAPLAGTKYIGGLTPDYTTFTDAINALNGAGVSAGGVTFVVADGTYNENPPAITVSGTELAPIIFQAATGANPIVTPTGGTGTFGFKLDGADYVTFDNIDVTGPDNLIYGYWLANGADNCTVQNATITMPYGSSTNYAILCDTGSNACSILDNTIASNTYYGIRIYGTSSVFIQDAVIARNVLSGIRNYGLYLYYVQNAQIENNSIACQDASTVTFYGIYIYGSNSSANVAYNTISGGYTSSLVYGMYNSSATTTFANNEITNLYNTGSSSWYGFYATGGTTIWDGNSIHGIANTGTASVYSAYITTGDHEFKNNNLYDIATGGTSLYGFYVIGGTTHSIYNNKVYNLRYTGTAGGIIYGIHLASGTTNNVYNNMIYDLRIATTTGTAPQIRAISITSGTTDNIWNNSVFLNSESSGASFSTAALYVTKSSDIIDLKNNIFVNKSVPGSSGKTVVFWKTSAGVGNFSADSDKNIYYAGVPDATHLIGYFSTTAYPTLAEYKLMADTKDQNSYREDVPFMSNTDPYDLHIDPDTATRVEGNAIPILPPVSFDIDNQARNATTPDIGADEGFFTVPAGAPGNAVLISPTNGALGVNPTELVVSWAAPITGGTTAYYGIYVSDSIDGILDGQYGEVDFPATSFDLNTIGGFNPGYLTPWYWAVLPYNADDEPADFDDPSFMVWGFTTSGQIMSDLQLALGTMWPGEIKSDVIEVQNLGGTELTFTASGPAEFEFGTFRYTIPANGSVNLPYTFTAPTEISPYTGTITLTETSPGSSTHLIDVSANISAEVILGDGTVTSLYLPIYPYYGYSYSQVIYPADWFDYPDGYRIEKLNYYYGPYTAPINTQDFKIWMGHTSLDAFPASSASWIPISEMTLVYDGTWNISDGEGWKEIVLQNSFTYNQTDNLVIAVDENTPGYNTSRYFYGTSTAREYHGIYYGNDSTNPDPVNPTITASSKAGYPNTKFVFGPVPTTPVFSITPEALNYGDIEIFNPSVGEFVIRNTGVSTLTVNPGDIYITNNTNNEFVVNAPGLPVSLGASEAYDFTVTFTPQTTGAKTATLNINDNLTTRVINQVPLSGNAIQEEMTYVIDLNGEAQNVNDAVLTWKSLTGTPGTPGWLHYDSGTNSTSVGLAGDTPNFDVAMKLSTDIVSDWTGMNLTKIKFYPKGASTTYTLKIWTGDDANLAPTTLAYSQAITTPTLNAWNEITLNTPFPITGTQAIWIGYNNDVTTSGIFPAGADAGPAVKGYGDLVYSDGVWWSLGTESTIDRNWNIQAYADIPSTGYVSSGTWLNIPVQNNPRSEKSITHNNVTVDINTNDADRGLRGFNVYRDGSPTPINADLVANYTYTDPDLLAGTYQYTVQAVHYSQNTPMSDPVSVLVPANDLMTTAITGPSMGRVDENLTYTVTVENNGTEAQSSYTVKLWSASGPTELLSLPVTTPLASGATAEIPLFWTPATAAEYDVYGQVVLTGDQIAGNNETASVKTYILPATSEIFTIGDHGTTTTNNYLPLSFSYNNSVSETIFYPDDMPHLVSGNVSAIVFKNKFTQDLMNKPVKIYMANSTLENLSAGWIAPENFTMVFNGNVDFPIGDNYVVIPLDTPFAYTGDNLVVRTNRPMDTEVFNSTNYFYYTYTYTTHPNRSRYLRSTSVTYDPLAPSAAGTISSYVPNSFLVFDSPIMESEAILEGYVRDGSANPITGATVTLTDERYTTTTNALGYYQFVFYEEHTVSATVSMPTYYSQTVENIELTLEHTVTQNFTLSTMPRVTINGIITANDVPGGLEGADVSLFGPENYSTVSGVNGAFSISNVLGSTTPISYTVVVEKDGYQTNTSNFSVTEVLTQNIGSINLIEYLWTPYNLVATHSGDNAQLVWDPAGEPDYIFFDFEDDNGGWVKSSNWTGTALPNYPDGDWGWTNTYNVANYNSAGGSDPQVPPTTAYSGTGMWGTEIYGPYSNCAVSGQRSFLRQTFDLSPFSNPILKLWHYMDGYNTWDYGQILVNGNVVWGTSALAVFMPWQEIVVSLAAYEGQTSVQISFEWSSTTVSNYAGWHIDDIYIGPATRNVAQLGSRNSDRSFENYDVYRFLAADEGNELNWTTLQTAYANTTYADNGFGSVDGGIYKWAVKANYTSGQESNAIISNTLGRVYDPSDIAATTVGATVVLSWTAEPGANYYKVYECDNPYGTFTYLGYSATPTYTVASPVAKKFYKVTAVADEAVPSPAPPAKLSK